MEKFLELQIKMLITNQENVQNHNYASDPSEWPFLTRGIAYYISKKSNVSRDFILYLLDVFMKCRYILHSTNLILCKLVAEQVPIPPLAYSTYFYLIPGSSTSPWERCDLVH